MALPSRRLSFIPKLAVAAAVTASYTTHAQNVSIPNGGTYTPNDTALYCLNFPYGANLWVQIYDGTAWRTQIGLDFRYANVFISDGSNVRLYNVSGGAITAYLITKKKPITVTRTTGSLTTGGQTMILPSGWISLAYWLVGDAYGIFQVYDGTVWQGLGPSPCYISDGVNTRLYLSYPNGGSLDYVYMRGLE